MKLMEYLRYCLVVIIFALISYGIVVGCTGCSTVDGFGDETYVWESWNVSTNKIIGIYTNELDKSEIH